MNGQEKDNLEFELSQYLDGQLSGWRTRRLERRLEREPALRAALQKYASLEGHLADLAGRELAGVDYDSQRLEVGRRLERRALLERPRRRPVVLRPWFLSAAGGLAIAAAVVAGALFLMSTPVGRPAPAGAEVSAMLVRPPVPQRGEAQVTLRRLEEKEIRLTDSGDGSQLPPGTVMVSVSPPPLEEWGVGAFPYPVE
jgi:anti-sigma factor RsiW